MGTKRIEQEQQHRRHQSDILDSDTEIDTLITLFKEQDLSDDQGIGSSCSSSPSSEKDIDDVEQDFLQQTLQEQLFRLLEGMESFVEKALDLRKNPDQPRETEYDSQPDKTIQVDDDDDDNSECNMPMDLSRSEKKKSSEITTSSSNVVIRSLSEEEKISLRHAFQRLVRFLRLDQMIQRPESFRNAAVKSLQSFLLMYMNEVKKKSPGNGLQMFLQFFGSDENIRNFFRVFMGKSKQLSSPSMRGSQPSGVVWPARFATDPDMVVPPQHPLIVSRGPADRISRTAIMGNAAHQPYPPVAQLRRTDSGGAPPGGNIAPSSAGPYHHSTGGWRNVGGHHQQPPQQQQQQQYRTPAREMYNFGQQPQQLHPFCPNPITNQQQTFNSFSPSLYEGEQFNVDDVLMIVNKLVFPFKDGDVAQLTNEDFEELYGQHFGPDKPLPERSDSYSIPDPEIYFIADSPSSASPSSRSSCQTPIHYQVPTGNLSAPNSPASPWTNWPPSPYSPSTPPQLQQHQQYQQHKQPQHQLHQPFPNSVMMSPPPSLPAVHSPVPGSPLPSSVDVSRIQLLPNSPQLAHSPTQVAKPSPTVTANHMVVENNKPEPPQPVMKSQPPPLIPLNPMEYNLPPPVEKQPLPPAQQQHPLKQQQHASKTFQTATQEMEASLDPVIKEKSMRKMVKSEVADLTNQDAEGDTPLMMACANHSITHENLYALVERLKGHPQPASVFATFNVRRETALFLACFFRRPVVAGYLSETMAGLGIPLNQTYQNGNTLIHQVSSWGENQVLTYLLRVRTADGKRPAFDINAPNREGRSALHEAVSLYQSNDPISQGFLDTIKLLLNYGANAGLSDKTSGKTAVHIAIEKRDPTLLELLLSKCPSAANAPMYNDNRPLHSAATLSSVTDVQQLELVNILLRYGADKTLRNKANKLPIELVQQDRDRVKAVLQARSRQQNSSNFSGMNP